MWTQKFCSISNGLGTYKILKNWKNWQWSLALPAEHSNKFLKIHLPEYFQKKCGRPVFLEELRLQEIVEMFPCILTKFLILYDKFCRHIQKYAFFMCYKK